MKSAKYWYSDVRNECVLVTKCTNSCRNIRARKIDGVWNCEIPSGVRQTSKPGGVCENPGVDLGVESPNPEATRMRDWLKPSENRIILDGILKSQPQTPQTPGFSARVWQIRTALNLGVGSLSFLLCCTIEVEFYDRDLDIRKRIDLGTRKSSIIRALSATLSPSPCGRKSQESWMKS